MRLSRNWRGGLAAVWIALGAGCALPGRGGHSVLVSTEFGAEIALPLQSRSVPVVQASIPGYGSGEFILDSGAQRTIFDRRHVQRWGLPLIRYDEPLRVTRGGAAAGSIEAHTIVGRLELGGAAALDLEPPVTDLSHLRRSLAGIIGQDVLRNWALVFDGRRREVTILPPDQVDATLARWAEQGTELTACPLTWWNGVPTLEVDLPDELHASMIVDTGASMTSLPRAAIDELELVPAGTRTRAHIGGTERPGIFRCPELGLANWRVRAWVVEHAGERGLLGYDVLGRCLMVLDGPRGVLWVAPRPR